MAFATLRDSRQQKKSYVQHTAPPQPPEIRTPKPENTTFYELPFSITLQTTAVDGRGLYAKSPISAGSVIMKKSPYVHAISTHFLPSYCSKCCSQKSQLHRCTKCKKVYYCDANCQGEDWALHKFECKALQQLATTEDPSGMTKENDAIPGEAIRCLARILWKKRFASTAEIRQVESMQSNRSFIAPSAYEAHTHLAHALMRYLGVTSPTQLEEEYKISSAAQLVDFISQFTINTFSLATTTLTPIGVAVSPLIALYNHSCEPNAAVVFPRSGDRSSEPEMRVVALCDIAASAQITTAYLDTSAPQHIRRSELKERYGFDCACDLCEKDWETAKQVDPREAMWCPMKCGGLCALPTDEVKVTTCTQCQNSISSSVADVDGIVDAVRVGREGLEKAEAIQDSDSKHAMKLTSNLIPLLVSGGVCGSAYPLLALRRLHLSLLLSTSQAMAPPQNIEDAKNAQQRLDEQVRTAAEVVYGLSSIHPAGHPARGVALLELGKILLVDEPLPPTHEYMTNNSTQFPPHGEGRLRLAHETLVRSHKEIQIGFGCDGDGGEVGQQARKLIVDVEKELTVWVSKAKRGAVKP